MFSTLVRNLAPSVSRTTATRSLACPSSSLARRAFASSSVVRAVTPPSGLPERERTIWEKLIDKFSPSQLRVEDVSGGCGTFYAIVIASDNFKGLPIVKQHRLVTDTLKQEIEGIHGLQIKTIVNSQ
ncbi:bola-like protein [Coprinellus micaceus]|uniref:Bola-like protein n=1 Tax=Coprinellus micaceus TaxID=71717 RepID=A0A4Y7TMG1_COPMI|nr:bola-like protein [Coprinellus micaceus]